MCVDDLSLSYDVFARAEIDASVHEAASHGAEPRAQAQALGPAAVRPLS